MENRRTIIASLGVGIAGMAAARAADAVFPHLNDDSPKATVVKGDPAKGEPAMLLDFGDGLRVPCDKSAFLTLFESKTFWLTVGAGRSSYLQRAQGEAVLYALGAMELLLMTLAFTPERLVNLNGGWRLKVQDTNNYVLGDIQLPGKPYWPINDSQFTGVGDANSPGLIGPIGGGGGAGTGPTRGNAGPLPTGPNLELMVDAFTSYIVMKKDCDLDYVRSRAQILLR